MTDNLHYGIIGNCKSAALVNKDSSIDWCCLPNFDSPSIFANLLDKNIGGRFAFRYPQASNVAQKYLKRSNVLCTRFESEQGIFEVIDFMPRYLIDGTSNFHAPSEIIRYVRRVNGFPLINVLYDPRLEYAKGSTTNKDKENHIISVVDIDKFDIIFLYSNLSTNKILTGNQFELVEDLFFCLSYNEKLVLPNLDYAKTELEKTLSYWRNWSNKGAEYQLYNDVIHRSALTLKLLSYDKTGAILAAVTTSVPESIGEERNWDYRYCWIRDASMVVKVISKLGHKRIVSRYLNFILDLIPDKADQLRIMYSIHGEKILAEKTLDHLAGYEDSKPVRIGNAAYTQKQHDIYGILMDAIHTQIVTYPNETDKHEDLWTIVKGLVMFVQKNWKFPDKGIWEFRSNDSHFTFSKLYCWVAIDRAISVAKIFNQWKRVDEWSPLCKEIKQDIFKNAWNDSLQSFTQSYGCSHLDSSILLMESCGLIEASDSRFISTVKAIERELMKDGLLYRYKNEDDFGIPTSSFTICTFWFINSLIKIGETKKAKKYFDNLLSYGNHLSLFSEDINFASKRLLGNFPQAYSHLALIEVALTFNSMSIS